MGRCELSVVIPTRDRPERLRETLAGLGRQVLEPDSTEILVVDNGSDPGSGSDCRPAPEPDAEGPVVIRFLREPQPGASAARNLALREARGHVILFLSDDTPPASDDLLTSHLELHRVHPEPEYAVLGRIDWDPGLEVSAFMDWLSRSGFLFSYDRLRPGPVPPSTNFISSHVSAKCSILRKVGAFDERFPYLMEDVELGIRLQVEGLSLSYHPELVVHHDHPQTLEGFLERMFEVGVAARRLHALWPDDAPPEVQRPRPRWVLYPPLDLTARAALEVNPPERFTERAWNLRVMAAYVRGYRSGVPGPLRSASSRSRHRAGPAC